MKSYDIESGTKLFNYRDMAELERYGLSLEAAHKYANYVRAHISEVVRFGLKLGVPQHQLSLHDNSKWSINEFPAYAKYFYEYEEWKPQDVIDDFNKAWLLHTRMNPHHWQYWILTTDDEAPNTLIEIPDNYLREMVADWLGVSSVFGTRLLDWWGTKKGRIQKNMNPYSYQKLEILLNEYAD